MLLQLSTWCEVESYLENSKGIIIPIGSTEQHGPTGLIGTDAICAEAIAKGVGEAPGAIVSPTVNVGMALHHTAFPGSISLRPSTLILVILDYLNFFNYSKKITAFKALIPLSKYSFEILSKVKEHSF